MTSPSFPPVLLDKCLDFAKHLTQLKTGRATIEVNLNQSRFYFSTDNSFYSPPGYAGRYQRRFPAKKKSPSDLRRDAQRREKFLEKKQEPSYSAAHSSTVPPTTAEQANLSWISDTPMTNEDDRSRNMDSEPSDSFKNASSKPISEKDHAKKPDFEQEKTIPMIISPINSPVKSKETPTEEVRIMFCAPNQPAAEIVSKQLKKSSYMGPKKGKPHLVFSTQLTAEEIVKLKEDVNQIFKLPKNIQIVSFYVFNEDKVYEEKHKCPGNS